MQFFVVTAKNSENSVDFFCALGLIDGSILSISGQARFLLSMSILSIKNKKPFNRWINNIDENETKSIV
jgi:hypothetical protein